MECLGTLPLPAPPQPTISQTFCWTDADSLELEQICKDLGISEAETDPFMSSSAPPAQFQLNLLSRPKACLTEAAAACPKKTRIKYKKNAVKPILGRKNAPRFPNGQFQKLLQHSGSEKTTSACASPTTSSTAFATTWTSAPDETLTKPMMSSSTIPLSFDLASLIYYTFILDHLKSNTNFEFNLHKNLFRKFYYSQINSFLDTALSAQPQSYKSLDSVISSPLRFRGF